MLLCGINNALGWSIDLGPPFGGDSPRHFLYGVNMSELSVFIDESGDFGSYREHSPYYIITLLFHEQENDIREHICNLQKHIEEHGFSRHHAIHSAPLIRREGDYRYLDISERRKLFRHLFTFMRHCNIKYKSFVFSKSATIGHDEQVSRISRTIGLFLNDNLVYLQKFDKIIVYYDNGQKEVTNLINSLFNAYLDAEVRKIAPSQYSLFQTADLFCTLSLIEEKLSKNKLSKSEVDFFMSKRKLKKNYLNPLKKYLM